MRSLLVLILFISSFISAQLNPQPEAQFIHPIETPYGILFTNITANSLYILNNGTVEELVNSPGCGQYFTVSQDGETIGFKMIAVDGRQAPALFNLAKRTVILLHEPVFQAGQVSFSQTGSIAYSIDNDVIVRNGSVIEKYPVGSYSNIVSLSPDGNYLAYNDDNDQIFLFNRQKNITTKITNGSGSFFQPMWSPVDNLICFSGLDASVFVHSVEQQETNYLGKGFDPMWNADGRSIIVERRETEKHTLINSDLFRISIDGKTVEQVTNTKNIFETSASIRKDNSILFASHTNTQFHSLLANGQIDFITTISKEKILPLKSERNNSLKKISNPSVYFEMPYTNQVYDTPDWYDGNWACGPTSSIMVIAYYGILPVWNVWCSPSGSSPGHFSAYGNYVCDRYRFKTIDYVTSAKDPNEKDSWGGFGYMWGSGSPYSRMVNYYISHGISATRADSSATFFNLVTTEVTNGYPFTLCNGLTTAGHIIVLNGIGVHPRTFIANDPYGNKTSGKYPSMNGKGVQYDWPGYNNGYSNLTKIYWGVAVRYTVPAIADSIVDDLQFTKGFSMSNTAPASMFSWKDMNQGYNGHMWYVKTKKSDTNFVQWKPTIAQDGNYEVSAYISMSNARSARYKIYHKNGMEIVIADQKAVSNAWLALGTFPFAKGTSGYVRLGDASDSTGQEIVFDAVQFKFLSPLSVLRNGDHVPTTISLDQNFPNPFNPVTTIRFSIPQTNSGNNVTLKVFDALGREMTTLVNDQLSAGEYSTSLDATSFSSGIFFYRLQIGNNLLTKKMILVK